MGASVSKIPTKSTNADYLLCGYIRNVEKDLLNLLIPSSIYIICLKYYKVSCHKNLLVFFYSNKCVLQQLNIRTNKTDTMKFRHLTANLGGIECREYFLSSICSVSQLKVPNVVHQKYQQNCGLNCPNSYNMVFYQHGTVSEAILTNDTLPSCNYQWSIPRMNDPIDSNYLLFSRYHSLISIGGRLRGQFLNVQKVYKLSFNDNNYYNNQTNKWDWKHIKTLGLPVHNASATFIGNNDEKLLVVGGYNPRPCCATSSCYFFDLTTKSKGFTHSVWCKVGRIAAGIYYDKYQKKVYLGGGHNNKNGIDQIEWYDTQKNQWFCLPQTTNVCHKYYPILWKDTLNNDLLYIASVGTVTKDTFMMESLDLRSNTAKWNMCNYKTIDNVDLIDNFNLRLLRFE